ncbi:hypothetical protein [Paenibacillus apiarius]|uniref:hypothetical protein n=1 Tax=Paenibacillus apiarius TaxID=46240 RepID=UPI001F08D376|nr:hypothetical protein [Paenibacillus apiarius]
MSPWRIKLNASYGLSSSLEDEVQEKIQQIHREYIGFLIVIADMMGIPAQDQDRFKEWSDALVGNDYERYVWCQREMTSYFTHIAEERRRDPQDDLISRLVQATADGEPLQPVQLISFCILLHVAGNETTTNLLSSACSALTAAGTLGTTFIKIAHCLRTLLKKYCATALPYK